MAHEFITQDSRLLLDSPILAVRQDSVVMPGGVAANREVVEHLGAVAVVALNEAGEIAMVRQYRHSVGRRLWELPAGLLDVAGEDELTGAQRELQEEAGLAAQTWHVLTDLVTSPGFCEEAVRVYLARELSDAPLLDAQGDEEADMTRAWVSLEEAVAMVLRGEIVNSIAVAGILAAHHAVASGAKLRPVTDAFGLRPQSMAARRTVEPGCDLKKIPLSPESAVGAEGAER